MFCDEDNDDRSQVLNSQIWDIVRISDCHVNVHNILEFQITLPTECTGWSRNQPNKTVGNRKHNHCNSWSYVEQTGLMIQSLNINVAQLGARAYSNMEAPKYIILWVTPVTRCDHACSHATVFQKVRVHVHETYSTYIRN